MPICSATSKKESMFYGLTDIEVNVQTVKLG
ncbi:MAG: hypothetical protein ACJAYK_000783 [Crocinitomicaceae bacterium]|jgi:hypothetical protein